MSYQQKFTEKIQQKSLTKVVDEDCEQKLLTKNKKSCEEILWLKVVNNSCYKDYLKKSYKFKMWKKLCT